MQTLTQVNKFYSYYKEIPKVLNKMKLSDLGMYAPNVAALLYNEIHTAYHGTKQPRLTEQYIDNETLPNNWKSLVTDKFRLNLVEIVSNSGMSYNNSNLPKNSTNKNSRKRVVEEEKLVEDDVYDHVIGKTKEAMYFCLNTGILFYIEKYKRKSTRITNGVAAETEKTTTIVLRSQMIAGRLEDAKLIDKISAYFASIYEFKLKDKAVENNPDENFITIYRLCIDANKELTAIATNVRKSPFNPKNYNDDVCKAYEDLVGLLNDNKNGIVQIHGIPGTGKTTMIRALAQDVHRPCYSISLALCEALFANPQHENFITNLTAEPCILVVEDAEHLIRSREGGNTNPALIALLQLIDGLTASNAAIIFTYNTAGEHVDEAIKRPGRSLADITIPALTKDKTDALLAEFEVSPDEKHNARMTLAEIYTYKPIITAPQSKSVGFNN